MQMLTDNESMEHDALISMANEAVTRFKHQNEVK